MQKVGILGGGQLGRMLLQAAANYPVETFVMESDADCPAAHLCHHFTKGDIKNFDDVYNFGKGLDAITIEIEAVNEDALEKLEAEGVSVYPKPSALRIIKNKILQKQFYKDNEIPTSEFVIPQNKTELQQHQNFLPAAHKIGMGGYDGRGVELFVDYDDNVLVNETAPRVHNSGHHTIEANYSSQFDMLWRIMLNYPLGNT